MSCGSSPIDIYEKGDFNGIVFVKFACEADRNTAIPMLKKLKLQEDGAKIWAKADQQIEGRVETSVLFGIKYLLSSWGYPRNCCWVDMDAKTVECGDQIFATVSINDRQLNVSYGNEWAAWGTFINEAALKDIITKAEEKLSQSSSKGKSKGKG